MIQLSWYEQFMVGMTVSFLTAISSQTKNQTVLAELQSNVAFLQKLMAGQIPSA